MPRYFFHVHDRHDLPEEDGAELPDVQAGRAEAIRAAGEMLRDIDGALTGEGWTMEVTDEAGRLVFTFRFSAVEHSP